MLRSQECLSFLPRCLSRAKSGIRRRAPSSYTHQILGDTTCRPLLMCSCRARCAALQSLCVGLAQRLHQAAWDTIKQKIIEEKLQKLGVERGSGSASSVPHIHAPHARAASVSLSRRVCRVAYEVTPNIASQISSPADPVLLFFKLNKLQQSQNASASNSLSSSPQPPSNLSPSPNQLPPRLQQNRHAHSISLAQPSSHQTPLYNRGSSGAFPFGPGATLGSGQVVTLPRAPPAIIHAQLGPGGVPTGGGEEVGRIAGGAAVMRHPGRRGRKGPRTRPARRRQARTMSMSRRRGTCQGASYVLTRYALCAPRRPVVAHQIYFIRVHCILCAA